MGGDSNNVHSLSIRVIQWDWKCLKKIKICHICNWTLKLHKSPYKHWFKADSTKCVTEDLSCLLTKLQSTIKDGLVRYCSTKTSSNGVNNIWILKKSTSLLLSLDKRDICIATSVQTFDFSTIYTSIPHDLQKSRISNLLYSYEKEFLANMIRSGHKRLARSFNLCHRYTDDLIVFNNKKFLHYLKEIYLPS